MKNTPRPECSGHSPFLRVSVISAPLLRGAVRRTEGVKTDIMKLEIKDINKVLILGAGTLGLRVALQSAISGFETTVYDIDDKAFKSAIKIQDGILRSLLKRELISEEEIEAVKGRLTFTTDAESAADDADFLNESVTENLELKNKFGLSSEVYVLKKPFSLQIPLTFCLLKLPKLQVDLSDSATFIFMMYSMPMS